MVISARQGPCGAIYATIPVPTDWPEQDVKIVEEDISDNVQNVRYRTLDDGVRQMLVNVARLDPGEKATVLVTFEVTRRALLPPPDTGVFPYSRKISLVMIANTWRVVMLIESRDSRIRDLAHESPARNGAGLVANRSPRVIGSRTTSSTKTDWCGERRRRYAKVKETTKTWPPSSLPFAGP